jgi:uncharacterized protein YjbI with pentapeptide repeats
MKQILKRVAVLVIVFHQQIVFGEVPAQVTAFKQAIQFGVKIPNCANCDFRGTQDLAGIDAHGAHLPGVNFQSCVPSDTNKKTMMICIPDRAANLTGINLANANLFSSCLDGAILDNADLTNVELSNSSARFASLKGAKISGIVTENSTFCNAIMPDGAVCSDSWTGQGVTIDCKCTDQDKASLTAAKKASTSPTTATSATPAASSSSKFSPKKPVSRVKNSQATPAA